MAESSAIRSNESEQLVRMIDQFWDNRVDFVKHIIGANPTDQQGDALVALDKHPSVAVRSGHGCGKSTVQSWLVLHYMATRPFPKIPCTAPTKHQLYDVLWAELSKWHRRMHRTSSGYLFSHQFRWTKERYFHQDHPEEWFAAARTATKENPEGLQGFHADYVLRIVDEASGVPEASFEVLDGAHGMIETKEFIAGNPTRTEGQFFHAFRKMAHLYENLTWSCLDSPIAPRQFIDKMKAKYGEASQIYCIRVLGRHHEGEGDAFIPYSIAFEATLREIEPQTNKPIFFGVDVARYGDDISVIAMRRGDEFLPWVELSKKSIQETSRHVAYHANKLKPEKIFVDTNGLGAGVYDWLEEHGYPVVSVNVSESPSFKADVYYRSRDELWGEMRDWLYERRGKMWDNDDGDLVGELTTPSFKIQNKGLIKIESKEDMKRRGIASPNRADACLLTFAEPMAQYVREDDLVFMAGGESKGNYNPIDPEAGY